MTESARPPRVEWRLVGTYYGIAFGGAVVMALVLWLLRLAPGEAIGLLGIVFTAVFYMPLPLVAALVTERVAGRRPLLAREWGALRHGFWRTCARNALLAVVAILAVMAVGFGVAWLAGLLGVPGAGHLVRDTAELQARLLEVVPGLSADTPVPVPIVLAASGIVQGVIAGLTINGLFAFGEEYGWRGVLADLLRPLGLGRATLLTGVLWGFWHAPIIVLGHNYGTEWGWGIPAMIAWTVPLSFLLTALRERTGSVLAPSFLHGAYNGVIGLFAYLIIGGALFVALPMGLLMVVVLALLAVVAWRLPGTLPSKSPEPGASTRHGSGRPVDHAV